MPARLCFTECGLSFWPREGGACLGSFTWGNIRTFVLSDSAGSVRMETNISNDPIRIYSSQSRKILMVRTSTRAIAIWTAKTTESLVFFCLLLSRAHT